jgi:metallo-beta-lactamase family protein
MRLEFLGASGGEVTGSAYVVETAEARVLVDCGLFQGGKKADALNRTPARWARGLDAVVLTHGHLDHVGRLPLLAKAGYEGPVLATPATVEMAGLILRDAARLQEGDNERVNRKRERAGLEPLPPLYGEREAEAILARMRPVPYVQPVRVAPGVEVAWTEAGHMLGSASLRVVAREGGVERRLVFSGDLGPRNAPILRDFEPLRGADVVVMESTYGDRDHRPFGETVEEFAGILREAVAGGGKILIPTFAVGRAQLLLTLLAGLFREGRVEPFPVFLDSPMAIEATKIYAGHRELFDDEMLRFERERPMAEDLRTLKLCVTADESRAINRQRGVHLVMAGAGMCNAGRIVHHLKQGLWRRDTHVIIVGYQGRGTLGRQLVDGVEAVKIHGEPVAVRAKVHTLGGFSAHAGQRDLLGWFESLAPGAPRLFLTHGEDGPREALAAEIAARHGARAELPGLGAVAELA